MGDLLSRVADIVRRHRPRGFFQSTDDRGPASGSEPGFLQVTIDLPRPPYGRMSDTDVARVILEFAKSQLGTDLDEETLDERFTLECDSDRLSRIDAECANEGDDAYVDLVHALARISRGAFRPTEIDEEWQEADGRVLVTFRLDGRLHTVPARLEGDWLDIAIIPRMNHLLPPDGPRFHAVDTGDQTALLVALTEREREEFERDLGWRFVPEEGLVRGVAREAGQAFEREVAAREGWEPGP